MACLFIMLLYPFFNWLTYYYICLALTYELLKYKKEDKTYE